MAHRLKASAAQIPLMLGLRSAVKAEARRVSVMDAGTCPCASLCETPINKLKLASSFRHILKYSLRLPSIPELRPRRASLRTLPKTCLSSDIWLTGAKSAMRSGIGCWGSAGRSLGSCNFLKVFSLPGARAAACKALAAWLSSPSSIRAAALVSLSCSSKLVLAGPATAWAWDCNSRSNHRPESKSILRFLSSLWPASPPLRALCNNFLGKSNNFQARSQGKRLPNWPGNLQLLRGPMSEFAGKSHVCMKERPWSSVPSSTTQHQG